MRARKTREYSQVSVLVPLLAFLGGIAALSWELLWQHHTALALGISAQGTAITLAATMGGMALGAIVAGNTLQRRSVDRPLRAVRPVGGNHRLVRIFAAPGLCAGRCDRREVFSDQSRDGRVGSSVVRRFAAGFAGLRDGGHDPRAGAGLSKISPLAFQVVRIQYGRCGDWNLLTGLCDTSKHRGQHDGCLCRLRQFCGCCNGDGPREPSAEFRSDDRPNKRSSAPDGASDFVSTRLRRGVCHGLCHVLSGSCLVPRDYRNVLQHDRCLCGDIVCSPRQPGIGRPACGTV